MKLQIRVANLISDILNWNSRMKVGNPLDIFKCTLFILSSTFLIITASSQNLWKLFGTREGKNNFHPAAYDHVVAVAATNILKLTRKGNEMTKIFCACKF